MKPKEKNRENLITENKELHRKILKLELLGKEQGMISTELSEKTKRLALIEANMIDCISQVASDGTFLYLSPSNEDVFIYRILK